MVRNPFIPVFFLSDSKASTGYFFIQMTKWSESR